MQHARSGALSSFWSESYFPALDGLRAICIAMVIINHMHESVPLHIVGSLGVDIFFVLSGFLITTLLLREREKHGIVTLKGFYTRRAFRIFPLYFCVLLLYIPAIKSTHDAIRWQEFKISLPYLLSFNQEFRPASAGNIFGHSWSLGFEEKFYFVWPLLVLTLYPARKWRMVIMLLLGTGLMVLPGQFGRSYGGLFLGSLLAVLIDRSTRSRLQVWFATIPTWASLCVVGLTYYLFVFRHAVPQLVFTTAIAVFVGTLVLRQSVMRSALGHTAMVLIGKRSYAMYLVHVLVLDSLETVLRHRNLSRWWLVWPCTLIGSFLVATVLYYIVEKPSIEYGRAISANFARHLRGKRSTGVPVIPIKNPL